MKEDLFNILSDSVRSTRFLDLYCGSGAVGIEALSRGAAHATFVDSSEAATNALLGNLRKTRLDCKAVVMRKTVDDAIRILTSQKQCYGIIFLDPPYGGGMPDEADLLGLMSHDGIVIMETSVRSPEPSFDSLSFIRGKKYANTQFFILGRSASTC
jgi:16S rRNA (guanine966-N2)-methyltransferase